MDGSVFYVVALVAIAVLLGRAVTLIVPGLFKIVVEGQHSGSNGGSVMIFTAKIEHKRVSNPQGDSRKRTAKKQRRKQ